MRQNYAYLYQAMLKHIILYDVEEDCQSIVKGDHK